MLYSTEWYTYNYIMMVHIFVNVRWSVCVLTSLQILMASITPVYLNCCKTFSLLNISLLFTSLGLMHLVDGVIQNVTHTGGVLPLVCDVQLVVVCGVQLVLVCGVQLVVVCGVQLVVVCGVQLVMVCGVQLVVVCGVQLVVVCGVQLVVVCGVQLVVVCGVQLVVVCGV